MQLGRARNRSNYSETTVATSPGDSLIMALQSPLKTATEQRLTENEIQVSYFVKKSNGKVSRVCEASLVDLSNAGLCMEISASDSELYMESQGNLFLLNKNIDLQIFCRSYPSNLSIEGHVKWIQRKEESGSSDDDNGILIGVLFRFEGLDQRQELAEFVNLLRIDTVNCQECEAPVSADAALCYRCGNRLVRRRAFLKKILDNLLVGNKAAVTK